MCRGKGHRSRPLDRSICKERLNVPTAAQDAKNQHIFVLETVDDDVLTHRKAPEARAQIVVSAATDVGIIGNQEKSICDGIN
jgi:hypothetical protein